MRKRILFLMMAVMTVTVSLNAQKFVLTENFEGGIPATWSQETNGVEVLWATECSDLKFPATAVSGSCRAYLRNPKQQTMGYNTKLVTPVLDLSAEFVGETPVLRFSYAQPKWTGDHDTLRIYYRTSPTSDWVVLAQYDEVANGWRREQLVLPTPSKTYQVAFGGSDNVGRGIVLDSVLVRSYPECSVPYNLFVKEETDTTALLGFIGTYDADEFEYIVSETKINDPESDITDESTFFIRKKMANYGLFEFSLEGLTSGKNYYVYIRSICESENSNWSEPLKLYLEKTVDLPYATDFNYQGNPGLLYLPSAVGWSRLTNSVGTGVYLATSIDDKTRLAKISPDTTVALCIARSFLSSTFEMIPLEAGRYACVVSPALKVNEATPMSSLQVRFTAGVEEYFSSNAYAHSLIVGVMSDATDYTTFEPIDTIVFVGGSQSYRDFRDVVVSFEGYSGNARYVALVSDFDKQNAVAVDNLVIERRNNLALNSNDFVVVPDTTGVQLNWKGNAQSYEIYISEDRVLNPALAIANASTTSAYVGNLKPFTHYYYSIRAVDGGKKGAWTTPLLFRTSAKIEELPCRVTMEESEGAFWNYDGFTGGKYPNRVNVITNSFKLFENADGKWATGAPTATTYLATAKKAAATSYKGDYSFYFVTPGEAGAVGETFIAMPMLEDVTKAQMTLMLASAANGTPCYVELGVMTNPNDPSTFEKLAEGSNSSTSFARLFVSFADYKGAAKYPAIRTAQPAIGVANTGYIDNIVVDSIRGCADVQNLRAAELNPTSVKLAWDVNPDVLGYDVKIFTSMPDVEKIDEAKDGLLVDTTGLEKELVVNGLQSTRTYYAFARANCSATEQSDWMASVVFTTPCFDKQPLPFYEDFEAYEATTSYATSWFPMCWERGNYNPSASVTSYMPYVYKSTAYNHTEGGSNAMRGYGYVSTTAGTAPSGPVWVALPEFEVADMKDLIIRYWWYSTSANSDTYAQIVGVMDDPTDLSTFTVVDSIVAPSSGLAQFAVSFKNYTGTGRYIAFRGVYGKSSYIYLDDVEVTELNCATPFGFELTNVGETSLSFTWEGKSADGWKYIVSEKILTPALLDSLDKGGVVEGVVAMEKVTTASATALGLTVNTPYYIYVRTECPGAVWAEFNARTACSTLNPYKYNKETFEDLPATTTMQRLLPPCWTLGTFATGGVPADSYMPSAYKSTTYANGNNAIRLYSYATATSTTPWNGGPVYVASPEIAVDDMSKLTVNYVQYSTSSTTATYYLVIGVMSDPEDPTTFVALDSTTHTGGKKIAYELSFENLPEAVRTTHKYVGFRNGYRGSLSYAYAYFDDVQFTVNTCESMKPTVNQVSDTGVVFTTNLRERAPWQLYITTEPLKTDSLGESTYRAAIPDSIVVLNQEFAANRTAYRVTTLESSTKYYYYVATVCDTIYGKWASGSFTTQCPAVALPFVDDFESYTWANTTYATADSGNVGCWIAGALGHESVTYLPFVYKSATYAKSGTNTLRFYSSTTYNGDYAMTPALRVDSLNNVMLTFWARGYSSTYIAGNYAHAIIVGAIEDPSDFATFTPIDTIQVTELVPTEYSVFFDNYKGEAKHIVFYSNFDKTNYYLYVDDVTVDYLPECMKPARIRANAEAYTADIAWRGNSNNYRVGVSTKEVDLAADVVTFDVADLKVNTNKVSLSKLNANTQYYVYVQGVCDTITTEWNSVSFKTECPARMALPYTTGFDDTPSGSGNITACWTNGYFTNGTLTNNNYAYTYSSAKYEGTNGLYFYSVKSSNTASMAITPEFDAPKLQALTLNIWSKKYSTTTTYTSKVYVGLVKDMDDPYNSFVVLDSIDPAATTWEKFEFNFSDYDQFLVDNNLSNVTRLGFLLDINKIIARGGASTLTYAYAYLDNFTVQRTPTCFQPDGLELTELADGSVAVKVNPDPRSTDQFLLRAWDAKIANPSAEDYLNYQIGQEDTISGLPFNKQINFSAAAYCGAGDTSAWTAPYSYAGIWMIDSTYTWDFEIASGYVSAYPGSAAATYPLHPSLKAYSYSTSGATSVTYVPYQTTETSTYDWGKGSKGGLRFYSYSTYPNPYVILPIIKGTNKQISFDLRGGCITASTGLVYTSYISPNAKLHVAVVDDATQKITDIAVVRPGSLTAGLLADSANNYLFDRFTTPLPADLTGKRVVLYMDEASTQYIFIDNLAIEEAKGYTTPTIKAASATDTEITVEWDVVSGETYNVFVTDSGYTIFDAPAQNIIRKKLADNTGKVVFTGLEPNSNYYVYVQLAGKGDAIDTYSARRAANTVCQAQPLQLYDFENNEVERLYPTSTTLADTAYLMPTCWTIGNEYSTTTKYYSPYIKKNGTTTSGVTESSTYANYKYAKSGDKCLVMGYASSSNKAYAVMPLMIADFDTCQVDFWGSCVYTTTATESATTTYLGTSYNQSLIVGTVTDPNDFSTFEPIETVTYTYKSGDFTGKTLKDDPNRFYQHFQVPLRGAKGKFVAFYYDPGYGYFFIDDVQIVKKNDCYPAKTVSAEAGIDTVALTFTTGADLGDVILQVSTDPDFATSALAANDTIKNLVYGTNSHVVRGLKPATGYYWRVTMTCGEKEWAAARFITDCLPIDASYTCGFEAKEGQSVTASSTTTDYYAPICWKTYSEDKPTASYSYIPYEYANSATLQYARTGEQCLQLYTYTGYPAAMAVMPAISNVDPDTLQMSFYGRCIYHNISTGAITTTSAGATYAKTVVVGVMSDPEDVSTFIALDTCRYTINAAGTATAANDYFWQHFIVSFKGVDLEKNPYIAFRAPKLDVAYNRMYVDDISFERLSECREAYDLSVLNVDLEEATVTWKHREGQAWYVNVSEAKTSALVSRELYKTDVATITGLKANTLYTFAVEQVCDTITMETAPLSATCEFSTIKLLPYLEQFENDHLNLNWTHRYGYADKIFSGEEQLTGMDGVSTIYTWRMLNSSIGVTGNHPYFNVYGTLGRSWLISEPMYLEDKGKVINMQFQLTRTDLTSSETKPNETGVDDQFMVIISEDAGKTWKRENATIWNNEKSDDPKAEGYRYGKGDYVFDNLPFKSDGSKVNAFIDLSKYAGKKIAIAFYGESTVSNCDSYVHIGRVHINYMDSILTTVSECQYVDFDAQDYMPEFPSSYPIDGDNVKPGMHWVQTTYISNAENTNDTVYRFTYNIIAAPKTYVDKEICEGDTISVDAFTQLTKDGKYVQKYDASTTATGCDSLVYLTLKVNPKQFTEFADSICQGNDYIWNGVIYNRAGAYTDTLLAESCGCDSIVTLVLAVMAPNVSNVDTTITLVQLPYNYMTVNYDINTYPGQYFDTIHVATSYGCDDVIYHKLTVENGTGVISTTYGKNKNIHKIFREGQLFIKVDDKWYDACGRAINRKEE